MRTSWDTSIKHLARHNLLNDVLTPDQIKSIPSSNLSRWKYENGDKYSFSELNEIIKTEVEFIKRMNSSSKIKQINKAYFKLIDTFHLVLENVKGIKTTINLQKELIVNTVESVKDIISIDNALKFFNLSRSTYQNYKTIVIHKCEASYFKWCSKRYPSQLLPPEIQIIKSYMSNSDYRHWSKSSIYLKAIRDKSLSCGLSTFYKYSRLLGFTNFKTFKKTDFYNTIKTTRSNEVWCADVTIFKTSDGIKHYIHILMDHYSKMVLGFRIENSSSGRATRSLLKKAYTRYKPIETIFLTDGGSENINELVRSFIDSNSNKIAHRIAQRDVRFSNSMIEAFNKVLKHQFLYPKNIKSRNALEKYLDQAIITYNINRPQWSLGGNTPLETFEGRSIDFGKYKCSFVQQKDIRRLLNKENSCKAC